MADKPTLSRAFNTHLTEFLADIINIYPSNTDIIQAKSYRYTMLYLAEPKEGLLFIKLDVPIQLLLLGRCGFYLGSTDFLLKTLDRPLRGRSTDTQCSIWQDLKSTYACSS